MPKPALKPIAKKYDAVPELIKMAYDLRNQLGSKCKWIFEVDYSISSKSPRFFVYNILKDDAKSHQGALYTYKCAHGRGSEGALPADGMCRQVSNKVDSGCSSLGHIRTLEIYTSSKVGRALRLEGLSPTNNNIHARGVVIHGSEYVYDNDSSTNKTTCGRSLGCIATAEAYIHHQDGGQLLDVLSSGSIGVAHYAGRFEI